MTVARREPADARPAQPRAELVDQLRNLSLLRLAAFQLQLRRIKTFGERHVQPDQVIAEPRIERVGEAVDPLAEQAHQQRDVAYRLTGLDPEALDQPVGTEQPYFPPPPTFVTLGQLLGGFGGKLRDHFQRVFGARDRFGETTLDADPGHGAPRDDRALHRPVEPADHHRRFLAEPRRDGGERACHHVADRLQTGARQGGGRILVESERRDRQPLHRALFIRRRRPRIPCKRPRGVGRVAERVAHQQPAPREALLEVGGKATLAFEFVHAPGDVEDQAIGLVERDRRRIALAPVREPLEPFVIGMRVMIVHLQFGHPRPCIGERQSRDESRPHRLAVERLQPHSARDRLDERDRRLSPSDEQMRPHRPQPLDRQPRKHQRQVAPRDHRLGLR